ncbi:MAG: hypothetical protein M1834_000271 [Cirrosporium novae-zelandiae]|nr:MAG: hypothetical protein M1834_000271 [Cirrosporium novae-zelandiae]
MPNNYELSPAVTESIAGVSAGVASTLVVHPLDIIKTRLQVNRTSTSSRLGSAFQIARSVFLNEGYLLAFYRGLVPSLVGNTVAWGFFFFSYGECKTLISNYNLRHANNNHGEDVEERNSSRTSALSAPQYFLASACAGGITTVLTNPIWVLKTRMLSTGALAPGAYHSMWDGGKQLYRAEGVRGFYRGLTPSLIGNSHGAFQFMAYERLKEWRARSRVHLTHASDGKALTSVEVSQILTNTDTLLISAVSKIFASSITYPYQVVRARLQIYDASTLYKGSLDVLGQVWRIEGMRGFYKGLGPSLVRVLPSTWVTFLVYENVREFLGRRA